MSMRRRRLGFLSLQVPVREAGGDCGAAGFFVVQAWRLVLFLPFVVGIGGAAVRILYLLDLPGSCSVCSGEVDGSPAAVRLDLLFWGLFLGVLATAVFTGVGVVLGSSRVAVVGGLGAGAKEPTVVVTYCGFLAAFQRLGSALWSGMATKGGVKSWYLARWSVKRRWWQDLGKKRNSSGQDLDVISVFLKDLSARKDCTVPLL